MQKYSIQDFERDFPDDESCLEWLREYLYPDGIYCKVCNDITKHHRVKSRPSYSCDRCGHHEHPTAGTVFQDSRTSLRLWFYAIYRMASTRCGISAKTLQRELGVTYKTAWRMFKQIRSLLTEDAEPVSGGVEVDETYFGGKAENMHAWRRVQRIQGRGAVGKTPVLGAVQRGGRVRAVKADHVDGETLLPFIKEYALPSSIIYTDEHAGYNGVAHMGYEHKRVHDSAKVYVIGDAHTNTIEGFWSLLKRSIDGSHHAVSDKYLQNYLDEYSFRYNHRKDTKPMFETMLHQVRKSHVFGG